MIKDLLKDNRIEAFIENELMGNIAPWNVSSGGVAPVKTKILNSDYALKNKSIESFTKAKNNCPTKITILKYKKMNDLKTLTGL